MGIRLRDDVFFENPELRIREYCEIEIYEGYDDKHTIDSDITMEDIESANKLFAMINHYDKSEGRRLISQSGALSPFIAEIPTTPIFEYKDEEWTNLRPKLESLLKKMTSIHGIGIAKSTKILHLKRPELFPVLDSFLVQFLTGKKFASSPKDTGLALKTMDISRKLMLNQLSEFNQLQSNIRDLPIPLTIARLFDILCWSTHKWDILKKTSTPKGRASKSLLGPRPKRFLSKIKINKPKARIKPSYTRNYSHSDSSSVVVDFYNDLSSSAKYGERGEKPLAVFAAVKYLYETKQTGMRFLSLLVSPKKNEIKRVFIDVAKRYGQLKSPSGSWSVITGSNLELQNKIRDNGEVNQALADLSRSNIEYLYQQLSAKYK